MRNRLPELCLGTLLSALVVGPAVASPALDESGTTDPALADPTLAVTQPAGDPVEFGVGLRLRNVRVPSAILELFVDRAAGGASNFGYGFELSRRRGSVELVLGLEFERVTVGEGVWIQKNKPVPTNEVDYVLAPEHAPDEEKLGWFTIDFTFVNHTAFNKYLALRYGGGLGLGILTGGLYRYDVMCAAGATNSNPEPGCKPSNLGGQGQVTAGPVKYDLPPVFPVVNAILGLQVKPTKNLVINVEGGIRTLPFFGTTVGFFF
jgi:hypothetical protein